MSHLTKDISHHLRSIVMVFEHTDPVVRNHYRQLRAVRIRRRNLNVPALRCKFNRIANDIQKDLLESRRISLERAVVAPQGGSAAGSLSFGLPRRRAQSPT
jgi:hypothetical protein